MIKQIKQLRNKREKGQVLVILALTITMLIAFIGLAVDMGYMYVSYARLRRGADSAALAATGQFKKSKLPADMQKAAVQFLQLNGMTNLTSVTVENCYFKYDGTTGVTTTYPAYPANGSGDLDLCKTPPQKLVRVVISQDVPTFFLAVIGWRKIPITVSSISEAASLDIVLVLDKSESMGQYDASYNIYPPGDNRDPKNCNPPGPSFTSGCHPFLEVKNAAKNFIDTWLYFPYDRAAIVTFAQMPTIIKIGSPGAIGLSGDVTAIDNALAGLTVYMGGDDLQGVIPGTCDSAQYGGYTSAHLDNAVYGYPYPCRLYSWSNDAVDPWPGVLDPGSSRGTFQGFDCPSASAAGYQAPPVPEDYSLCQTSNIGGGLRAAASIFSGTSGPAPRQEALWVTILLTDGVANGSSDDNFSPPGHPNGFPYCSGTSSNGSEKSKAPICRDTNALARHCLTAATSTYPCPNEADPVKYPGLEVAGSTNVVNATQYDADDYARDQADVLHDGVHSIIFAIGIGSTNPAVYNEITATVGKDGFTVLADPGTPPSGATLLNYITVKGETDKYYASDPAGLQKVFLAIANRIATRLSK